MLRLDDDPRFIATANVNLKGRKASFQVEFHLLPTDVLRAEQEAERKVLEEGGDLVAVQHAFMRKVVAGWPEGEVADKDGKPRPFSEEALTRLLCEPGVPLALVQAFYTGYETAIEGN